MVFLILLSLSCVLMSVLYVESTLALFFLISLLFLLVWSSFFSKRVLLGSFPKKKPLHETDHFRKQKIFDEELGTKNSTNSTGVKVFIYSNKKDIQFYFIDTKPLTVICSRFLLEVHSDQELHSLLKGASLVHKSHRFKNRQRLVALFIHIGRVFKQIDSLLCFTLGVNTIEGEPQMILRRVASPILNWLCSVLVPGAQKSPELKKLKTVHLIKSQSYLDTNHQDPLFSPLSLTDYILYQD